MRLLRYLIEAREQLKQWNKYVKDNKELQAGVKILNKLNKAKFKAYIVGGSVRDIILGNLKPHDVDIATNASIDALNRLFKTYDIGKSREFGIVTVREGSFQFEIAQFRNDGKYTDGRRPESVTVTGSFEEDAARRDFTINAMGINAKGEILDFFDGKKDIQNKILRTVGDPRQRFGEDYLRMLRAPRFAAKLGLDIEKSTEKAIQKLSTNIKDLAPERIQQELVKSAGQSGERFADYILLLDKLKLLKHIMPEVVNLKWYRENLQHHPETRGEGGTVYSHVLHALRKSGTADPIKNLAILLHDVGKGVTATQEKGLPKYLGHAKASMNLVKDLSKRLKLSNKDRDALIFAVSNHMKFHNLLKMRPSKIAKLVNDENWDVLVAVAKADEMARGDAFMHAGEFEKIVDKAIEIKNKFGMPIVNNQCRLSIIN
jgi:tRNA nucleotidyltransferase/poly(A) polymerase